jgi:hypothetical protein
MRLFTILIIILCFINCKQTNKNQETARVEISPSNPDTSVIAVLPYDTAPWIFKNHEQSELKNADYQLIEKLLTECIDKYNCDTGKYIYPYTIINLNNYQKGNIVIRVRTLTYKKTQYYVEDNL